MSEIEKMYANAGVKKQYDYIVIKKNYNGKIEYTKRAVLEKVEQFKNKTLRIIEVCPFYPDFTAEKQLELIKWLINFDYTHLSKLYGADINFSVVLAATINYLWKCLSKSEQEQIRRILNE